MRKGTMTSFVLYLPDHFALRCMMVELHLKQKAFGSQPSAISQNQQQRQNIFTAKDAKGAEENRTEVGQTYANLGSGGIPLEGEGGTDRVIP
jgi:hypothetical protein